MSRKRLFCVRTEDREVLTMHGVLVVCLTEYCFLSVYLGILVEVSLPS